MSWWLNAAIFCLQIVRVLKRSCLPQGTRVGLEIGSISLILWSQKLDMVAPCCTMLHPKVPLNSSWMRLRGSKWFTPGLRGPKFRRDRNGSMGLTVRQPTCDRAQNYLLVRGLFQVDVCSIPNWNDHSKTRDLYNFVHTIESSIQISYVYLFIYIFIYIYIFWIYDDIWSCQKCNLWVSKSGFSLQDSSSPHPGAMVGARIFYGCPAPAPGTWGLTYGGWKKSCSW